jgi:signal transduction histidine kinase
VQLGQQQFLPGIPGLVIRDGLGGQRLPGSLRSVCGVSAALVAVSAAFLALRRVRPLTALTGALGGLAAVYLALGHYEAGAAVLIVVIATYSAGAYGRNLPFTVAVVFAFGVTTGLRQPAAEALPDMAWSWAVLALALGVGLTARRLRGQSQSAQRQVRQMQQEQQALAEAAARQERQRIARELHDIISHGLGVVVLQAGAAEQVLDQDPGKAREAMQLIRATGQEAITELGTLVALIRDEQPPGRDPQPTLRDVERLAATTRSAGLAVTVQTDGQPRDLPASVELNAYRVVQEGLTNALKHAPGSTVQVVLRYHPTPAGWTSRCAMTARTPQAAPAADGAWPGCGNAPPCSAGSSRPGATRGAAGRSAPPSPPRHDPRPARR